MVDLSSQRLNNVTPAIKGGPSSLEWSGWVAVGLLVLGLVLATGWNQMEIMNLKYEIEEFRAQNRELRDENAAYRAEYQSLIDPEKIAEKAREMGLIAANQPQVTILHTLVPPQASGRLVARVRSQPDTLRE